MDRVPPPLPRTAIVVRGLLAVAALLMVAGHVAIEGKVFDPIGGETYNVYSRWVSDYAGRPGEGAWIKASIAVFGAAIALLYRGFSLGFATGGRGVVVALGLQLLAAGMVCGLVLVAIFDISPRQFEVVEDLQRIDRVGRDGAATASQPTGPTEPEQPQDRGATLAALLVGDGMSLREEIFREVLLEDDEDEALMAELRALRHDPDEMRRALQTWRQARTLAEAEAPPESPSLRRLPLRPRQRVKERYHRIGFRLFLLAFVATALTGVAYEVRRRQHRRLPGTLLLLVLSIAFGLWLFIEHLGLAGIPQRALLTVIGVWMWRHASHLVPAPA